MDHRACIGIGSNQGERQAAAAEAVRRVSGLAGVADVRVSSLHETEPVGGPPGQPRFINAAASLLTTLSPEDLLGRLHEIEIAMGRVRTQRWGPRTIDLDLLLYDDRIINSPELTLPHPRLHERRFVLEPLAEVAGDLLHPVLNKPIIQLLAELRSQA